MCTIKRIQNVQKIPAQKKCVLMQTQKKNQDLEKIPTQKQFGLRKKNVLRKNADLEKMCPQKKFRT